MPSKIRIALDDAMKQKQVDALAYRDEWSLDQVIQRTDERPQEVVWTTRDPRAEIHYVEDFLLQKRYVVLRGAGAENVAEVIRAKLKTVSGADVVKRFHAAKKPGELIDALYLAAIVAPEQADAALRPVLDAGFTADDTEVRRAAIFAAGYAEWPELGKPLAKLAHDDPDDAVREQAAAMLEGLEKVWKKRDA